MKIRNLIATIIVAFSFSFAVAQTSAPVAQSITNINGIVSQVAGGTSKSAQQMQHVRDCMAKVRAGIGSCIGLLEGDSLTMGASSTTNYLNYQNEGYWFASRLNNVVTDNLPVDANGVCGFGNSLMNRLTSDNRFVNTGFTPALGGGLGGAVAVTTSTANTLTFAPGIYGSTYNKISVLFYYGSTGSATGSVQIAGGTSVTGSITGAGLFWVTATTPSTPSTSLITTISMSAGASLGVECEYTDNTNVNGGAQIHLINAGLSGAYLVNMEGPPAGYGPAAVIAAIAPDFDVATVGDTDWHVPNPPTTTAVLIPELQSLETEVQASGDFILSMGIPNTTNISTQVLYQQAFAVQAALPQTNAPYGVPFFDLWSLWGGAGPSGTVSGYTQNNTLGWMYDTLHPSTKGNAVWGDQEANFFKSQ